MMKIIVFLLVLILTQALRAKEVETLSTHNIYSPEEIYLLQQLSKRHSELLEKQATLEAKEKELTQKEAFLNEILSQNQQEIRKKTSEKAKLYTQLPPSKAVKLLNELPEEQVADILSQLPNNIASRLLGKMEEERIKVILQNIPSSDI